MPVIKSIKGRQVVDSRGRPTVEVECRTTRGCGRAIVPSGASTGVNEALELRDGGKAWHGKGVTKAVRNVGLLGRKIVGKSFSQQRLDAALNEFDGTSNKSKYGANAILGISLAFAKAAASHEGLELYEYLQSMSQKKLSLPVPCFNVINGGKHAGTKLPFQEYMLLPVRATNYSEALRMGSEIYHELKALLNRRFGPSSTNVGDEGGFVPPFECYEKPLDFLVEATDKCGFSRKVKIGMDVAASTFYARGKYFLEGRRLSTHELLDEYVRLVRDYPLVSIEDPFEEDDFDGFAELRKALGQRCQVVGDDLLCTNPQRVQKAVRKNSCNCLLLKPNQIGTVSETLLSSQLAHHAGWRVMASHRSGDTEDPFIADVAVGLGCEMLKSGAPCRGERTSKYNRLLRMERVRAYARW